VQRVVERAHAHVDVHDAAKARGERRQPGVEVRGVREHEHVASQPLALRAQEAREMERADLLLALDDPLHVDRKASLALEPGALRSDVEQDARLVVHDAAPVEASVAAAGRLEGRRPPVREPSRWLHVVVGVDERRRRVGSCVEPLAQHVGVRAGHAQDLDALHAGAFEQLRDVGSRSFELRGIEAARRDARDRRQLHQLLDARFEAALERVGDRSGCPHARHRSTAG
jgi:hypothetical protein